VTGAAKQPRRSIVPLLSGVILRAQSDERLCELARKGSRPAFETIFERYNGELGAHAGRIVRPDRADDVVQQAMVKAWTTIVAGEDVADLRAWLHRIVHNAALNTIARRSYHDAAIPAHSPGATRTEELVESRLTAAGTLAALAALPEGQRRALTLTAIDGYDGREAAQAMGISEPALRQLLRRARSSMRSGMSAITPVPLLAWATTGAGDYATAGLAGAGAAGGLAVTAAKIATVIGVTGAAIGGVHVLQAENGHKSRPASKAGTSATGARVFTPALGLVPLAGSLGSYGRRRADGDAGELSGGERSAHGQSQRDPNEGGDVRSGSDGGDRGARDQRGPGAGGAGGTTDESPTAGTPGSRTAGNEGSRTAGNGAPGTPDNGGPTGSSDGAPSWDSASP
jgi:RNA polymerase sigma factor (sigma-70 family)